MAFDIAAWNLADNRQWWVRLEDAGSGILVGLYLSETDALAGTARQAYGTSAAYGSGVEIILILDGGAADSIAMLQAEYSWHVKASGQAAGPGAAGGPFCGVARNLP